MGKERSAGGNLAHRVRHVLIKKHRAVGADMADSELVLEYLKTILGTMAWPLAVVFLLMIYRIEIVKLSERLKRARLPGGTDLDFDAQQLAQKAANETPELSSQDESPQVSSLILERISSEPELGLAQLRIELERIVRAIYLLGAVKKMSGGRCR
jgi:hypothetical protein